MKITIIATTAELAEMGLPSAGALSSAVLERLDQEGVEYDGRQFDLSGFNVDAQVIDAGAAANLDPTDLDSLLASLIAVRAQQGNMLLKTCPPGSGGQLVPASIGVGRMGATGSPRLVSRGGHPVLVIG